MCILIYCNNYIENIDILFDYHILIMPICMSLQEFVKSKYSYFYYIFFSYVHFVLLKDQGLPEEVFS